MIAEIRLTVPNGQIISNWSTESSESVMMMMIDDDDDDDILRNMSKRTYESSHTG